VKMTMAELCTRVNAMTPWDFMQQRWERGVHSVGGPGSGKTTTAVLVALFNAINYPGEMHEFVTGSMHNALYVEKLLHNFAKLAGHPEAAARIRVTGVGTIPVTTITTTDIDGNYKAGIRGQ